ncbi:MAG: DUF4332 domain-containing protein [Chloroflexota bacterium]
MQSRTSLMNKLGYMIGGVIIGLLLGLYIGWIAWPVTWENATPSVLDAASRQNFLRAAIDSFSLTGDIELAAQRYESLGEYAASTLGAIYSNPQEQPAQVVEAFAVAVGATQALQGPPGAAPAEAPGAEPASAGGAGALGGYLVSGALALVALLIGLLLVLLVLRSLRNRTRSRRPTPAEEQTAAGSSALEPLPAAGTAEVYPFEEEVQPSTAEPITTGQIAGQADAEPGDAVPGDLPDWLQEEAPPAPQPAPAQPVDVFEPPALEDEAQLGVLPDWLSDQAPQAEQPTAPASEQPAEAVPAEIPDWLADQAAQEAPLTADATAAVPAEIPDWLMDQAPQEAGEAAEALAFEAGADAWEPDETPEETHAKFSRDLSTLPAMDETFAARLKSAGVSAPLTLLRKGADEQGRLALAERAGVDAAELESWVHLTDLLRVRGVTAEHAILLDGVGVHGVAGLAQADAAALQQELAAANAEYNLLARAPSQAQVRSWIELAGQLPPAIT